MVKEHSCIQVIREVHKEFHSILPGNHHLVVGCQPGVLVLSLLPGPFLYID